MGKRAFDQIFDEVSIFMSKKKPYDPSDPPFVLGIQGTEDEFVTFDRSVHEVRRERRKGACGDLPKTRCLVFEWRNVDMSDQEELSERFDEIFFEVYEWLPRQGPGSRESTARALAICGELPEEPVIYDMGCGSGAQTLDLAALSGGTITAIDSHAPLIVKLEQEVKARGLQERVRPIVGDMAEPPAAPGSVDLIWSEGAAYFLGVEAALSLWRPLLRPRGYLAFTEAVWLRTDPPKAVLEMWHKEYPSITDVGANLAIARRCGYEIQGHFTLPESDWWDQFYAPMEERIAALRQIYAGDDRALWVLDEIHGEVELHRQFGDYYGYEFIILRAVA